MRALRFALDEAIASLSARPPSGLLSTGTISVAMFVLGGFLVVTSNLERLAEEWSRAAEMSVYLADDITETDRQAVEDSLKPGDFVAGFEFVSKGEALNRFKATFSDLAQTISSVGENPLPASYEVRFRPEAQASIAVEQLADTLRKTNGVVDVRYDREWLNRLMSAVALVRSVGFVLGAILILAAALTVATVVRLSLNARRDEIEIMQLVGAPAAYLRGPFVMEGVIQGGAGAAAALIGLGLVFLSLRGRYLLPLAQTVNLSSVRFISLQVVVGLLIGGMAVGCLGGWLASRRT